MKTLKKYLKITSLTLGTITVLHTSYIIKELDLLSNPSLIPTFIKRSLIIPLSGLKMIYIYKEPFSGLTSYERNVRAAVVLRKTCEIGGGCLLKIGQNIGCLNLLIPEEFCDEMVKLFENCPTNDFSIVKETLENELGDKIENIFSKFEEVPFSSASLSQVHLGVLRLNNQKVAVKIQHNEIGDLIKLDIFMVEYLVNLGNFFFKNFHFDWLLRETKRNIYEEINFLNEIKNCEKLKPILKNTNVKTPKFYKNYSTSKILTMEYIDGYSITNVDRLKKDNIDIGDVSKVLTNIFNKMIFQYGFFHGDPHPGNIFISKRKNSKKYDLVLLDHGLYRFLNDKTKLNYSRLWSGIFLRDEKLMLKAVKDIGIKKHFKLFTEMLARQEFDKLINDNEKDFKKGMKEYEIDVVRKYIIDHRIEILECFEEMDPDLVLIFKITDYLNHIDYKLGKPINNYYYTAKFSFKIFKNDIIYKNYFEKIKTNFLMYITLFFIKFYEYYLKLKYNLTFH